MKLGHSGTHGVAPSCAVRCVFVFMKKNRKSSCHSTAFGTAFGAFGLKPTDEVQFPSDVPSDLVFMWKFLI